MQKSGEQSTFGSVLPEQRGGAFATEEDIYYAYRLLLGRDPDAQGWADLRKAIADRQISPSELAESFINSQEFASQHAEVPHEGSLVEVALDGFSLFVRENDRDIGRHIRATRQYEPHVTAAMKGLLRPGNIFVDIGANIGFFTNLAARLVGEEGFVVAVEPLDKNVQLIHRSLDRNGFEHVRVEACAASDRDGRVAITSHRGTSNGQVVRPGTPSQQLVFAQTRRLDDLTADLKRLDLVKFDIEGCELLAWRGFQHSLEKHRPRVLTEFHPHCMRTFIGVEPREYLDALFAYAGDLYVLTVDGQHISCRTPEDVMRRWENANGASGADGKEHLDLLVLPRA